MRRGALVLVGGRSTRMGRDKATLAFGERTLLEHVLGRLRPLVDELLVVSRPGQGLPPLAPDVAQVHDQVLDRGPLGGLAAGLAAATADALYVSSCDAPFVEPALVRLLFERLGEADVAVAEAEGRLHPLAAVYRRRVEPHVRALLAEDRLRPVFLYERVPTVRVPEADLRAADPELRTLENLNTPAEHAAALTRLAAAPGRVPRVRVELHETARRRAGVASADVEGATLGAALAALARRCPGLVPDVIADGRLATTWYASVNGGIVVVDPATPLADGDFVVLFSPLAGG